MKLFKKITAILLCVLMVMSVASCGEDTSWVIKTDKTTTTSGMYLYYLLGAYSNAYNFVEDPEKDIISQTIDGVKAEEWIKNTAMDSAKFATVILERFDEKKLALSEENEQYAKQYADYYWGVAGQVYLNHGVTYDTFLKCIKIDLMVSQLFETVYGKGGEKEISAEDMKKGLAENFVKVKEIGISLAGITGEMRSDKVQENLKQKAEDYKKRIEAGEKIEDLIKEHYKLEVDLAVEESGKTAEELMGGSTADDVDTDFVVISKNATNYSENEINEVFKLENGKVVVLVEKEYVRVIQKYDILEDETLLEQYDYDIRVSLKAEEFTEEIEAAAKDLVVEVNEAALKKYKPSKIRLQ